MKNFIIAIFATILIGSSCWAEVSDSLISAIIACESGGDPNARGEAGEIGLMQISKIVLTEYNMINKGGALIYNLLEPEFNKTVGTWYLKRLKDHYIPKDKYSVELLCACYNAGPTKMRKLDWEWKKAPQSTRAYIKKVLKEMR